MKSDIDPASFHGVLFEDSGYRIQSPQVFATSIVNLDFAM